MNLTGKAKELASKTEMGFYMPDVDGHLWGIAKYDELNKKNLLCRLFAKISKRYKRKFLLIHPIGIDTINDKRTKIDY